MAEVLREFTFDDFTVAEGWQLAGFGQVMPHDHDTILVQPISR